MKHPHLQNSRQIRERTPGQLAVIVLVLLLGAGAGVMGYYFIPNIDLLFRPAQKARNEPPARVSVTLESNRFYVPANILVRVKRRALGPVRQFDIQLAWPAKRDLSELNPQQADDFNNWILVTFEAGKGLITPERRFNTIYRHYIKAPARTHTSGLQLFALSDQSPYQGLELLVDRNQKTPAVVRCDTKISSFGIFMCEHEFRLGQAIMVTLHFPRKHLKNWRKIESYLRSTIATFRKDI